VIYREYVSIGITSVCCAKVAKLLLDIELAHPLGDNLSIVNVPLQVELASRISPRFRASYAIVNEGISKGACRYY